MGQVTFGQATGGGGGGGTSGFGNIYQGVGTGSRAQLGTGNQLNPGGNVPYLTGFIAPSASPFGHITVFVGTGGGDSGYMGLYHLTSANNGVLVAQTALSSLAPTTNTPITLAFTASYTPIPGDPYAAALMQTTNIGSSYYTNGGNTIPPPVQVSPNAPVVSYFISGAGSTLPASFTYTAANVGGGGIYFEITT